MQTAVQQLSVDTPRTFRYSLDWRFLLPVSDAGRIRVLAEDDAELRVALERVGISFCTPLTFPSPAQGGQNGVSSFALPLGLPARWVDARLGDQIEFCRSIARLMKPGGYLLVGFDNIWNVRRRTAAIYHSSTPRLMTHQLLQAGFQSVKLFGAMPNLNIPEYIFHLDERAVHFALGQRFRRKPRILQAVRALARTMGMERLSNYLPCYFAVAAV